MTAHNQSTPPAARGVLRLVEEEARRQAEFPVCARRIFLAHAGVSPLPRCVAAAMQQYLESATGDNQEIVLPATLVADTRQLAARLLDAHPDEIAFTGSTSMGLGMIAAGLDWQPGDNVVCYRDDYPANVYPWLDLTRRGVAVRFVEPAQYGNVTAEDVARAVDCRTRLVSLASVHFVTGWRLDVAAIGRMLRERGVLFCLDGIQSLGALRTTMADVDFAAADAHKWLLGPLGAALLYVRRERQAQLHPSLIGWASGPCPGFVARDHLQLWPTARRYEPGSLNVVGLVGLQAALRLLLDIGLATIEDRVLTLSRLLTEELRTKGYHLAGPVSATGRSGVVSFASATRNAADIHARLTQAGIVSSLRQTRDEQHYVRLAPHFYNTETELRKTLEIL